MRRPGTRVAVCVLLAAGSACAQPAGSPPSPAPPAGGEAHIQSAPQGPRGTLAIRGVQGTVGAEALGVTEVEIDFVRANRSVKHLSTKFDERGVIIVDDVPLGPDIRPLVRIKYAGVTYQEFGPELTESSPRASMTVTVFETTETAPAWRIPMRHVMATAAAGGYEVSETVVVENPTDRTWVGGPADAQGRRPVVQLGMPAGSEAIHLDAGFHGWCCTAVSGRTLTVQMPLMPGKATFKFSYRVPASAGKSDLRIGAAAPIENAMFFVPDDSSRVEASGVEAQGAEAIGPARMRMFHGKQIQPGTLAGVMLEASTEPVAAAAAPLPFGTELVIGAGVIVLLLGIGVYAYARSARRSAVGVHIRHGGPPS